MELTLRQKREIVRRFIGGELLYEIATTPKFWKGFAISWGTDHMQGVLREYMNGKFKIHGTFKARGRASREGEE